MKFTYNSPHQKNRRRILRRNQSDAERLIWHYLRSKQFYGLKFFRQYGIGLYILDFYCPERRLAIEIDGGQHAKENQEIIDSKRTEYLKSRNIIVVRFWNNEVLDNIDGVLEKIKEVARI